MSDALRCGRRFRTLNIIDDYNREALPVTANTSLPAQHVTRHIDKVALTHGYPEMIRVDNDNGLNFCQAILENGQKIIKYLFDIYNQESLYKMHLSLK